MRGAKITVWEELDSLLVKKLVDKIKSYKRLSNRIAYTVLEIKEKVKMQIIQVYAPTQSYEEEEAENFYEQVSTAMEECKTKYKIVMGDFNAKLGAKQVENEQKIGKFGLGIRNERQDMLYNFLEQQNLYAMNTFFKNKSQKHMDVNESRWIHKERIRFYHF